MAARWYIVHAHSGSEKKVAQAIEEQAARKGMSHLIEKVAVPTDSVTEMKKGKKVNTERKFFPGYVMVKMEMNEAAWHLIKGIPKVTGFLGGNGNKPQPISDTEAESIFRQVEEGGSAIRKNISFEVGETVKVIEGPFETFVGVVEEVDSDRNRLKVAVSIFGRSTPVELEYAQVEKA
ncbi:MAG: transcription termination/antitermination protein NusG [Proteobacteria bacterium]|nr:transcription termination/antitermination protein NusG [Pseudomonadota bacterium]